MKYEIIVSNRFKKDLKRCQKRGLDMKSIYEAMSILGSTGSLPPQYFPHRLKGNFVGQWECHIQPDWLMTWEQNDKQLTLLFLHTGSHSDLF